MGGAEASPIAAAWAQTKRTTYLWTFWGAGLASFRYQPPFLQRRKASRFRERMARIAEYESLQDVKRPPNCEGSCKDHHQDKEHNLSFAEVTSGGPRGLVISSPSTLAHISTLKFSLYRLAPKICETGMSGLSRSLEVR